MAVDACDPLAIRRIVGIECERHALNVERQARRDGLDQLVNAFASRSMKPTVSDTRNSRLSGRCTCRTTGSSVTKSASDASASALASTLNSVVLPAFV